jgi:hypothetical protein
MSLPAVAIMVKKKSPCRKAAIFSIAIVAAIALIQVFRNSFNISNCYNNLQQDHPHFGSSFNNASPLQELDYLKNDLNSSSTIMVAANTTGTTAAEQYYYKTHKLPPQILHVLWGRPLSTIDSTYNGKERKFDEDSFTGCCDQLVELALKSYVENLPKGYSIYFWNIGGWDSVGFLRHIGLYTDNDDDDESVAIKPMEFDPQIEMAADEPQLINIYQQLQAVVPRGDFVRYYVMKKYGGSYVDLDGVLVRSIPYKEGIPMMNLSPASQTNLDLLSCTGRGYVRQPSACILSNGLFVGFPANHAIFHIIMMTIKKETRTCGGKSYFCYGPQWMTRVILNEGIRNMADLGIEVGPFLRDNGSYKHESEVFIAHFGLGIGNSKLVGDSLCHASAVHSELCQKFNVTERSRDTSSTADNKSGVAGWVKDESSALDNSTLDNSSLDNKRAYSKPQMHQHKT